MASTKLPPRQSLPATLAYLNALVERAQIFNRCSWSTPESSPGACDGGEPCCEVAAVHDLEADQGFCLRHYHNRDGVR